MTYSGWPASGDKPASTSTDADSDSIKAARVDIQKAVLALNKIIDLFSNLESEPTDNHIIRYDASSGKFETTADLDTDSQNLFNTISVAGQSNVVADSSTDTLTLVAGSNITLTTDASADSVTIAGSSTNIGLHDIWIPAQGMYPTTTNGASSIATSEVSSGKPEVRSLAFATGADDFAQFSIAMPKSWNEGTITAEFYWTASASSGGVTWGLQGVALSEGDPHNTAFGTAQVVDDTLTTTNDVHVSPTTSDITIGGSPAAGDIVYFQVYRDVSDSNDTLGADAKLIGVKLHYTSEAGTDA
jgi:hypothetical protein